MSGARVMTALERVNRALVAKGWHDLSPWWRATLADFYGSRARRGVFRVGRRGGKSTSVSRVLVAEALAGHHRIPPGDAGTVAIVSVDRTEASQRLRTITAALDALGLGHRPAKWGEGVELVDRPIVFRVVTASTRSAVGFTAIAVLCDEVARWRDSDTNANPADDVLASLSPSMASMPHAKLFMVSSPLGSDDAHARAFELGHTEHQRAYAAPTWLANPTITEADTHALEPDARVWRREYAAEPQAGALGAFDPDLVAAAVRELRTTEHEHEGIMVLDSSAGRGDSWTWALARWAEETSAENALLLGPDGFPLYGSNGAPLANRAWSPPVRRVHVHALGAVEGAFHDRYSSDDVVHHVSRIARQHGASVAVADQYQAFPLASAFRREGITLQAVNWTNTSKGLAVTRLRTWLREGLIVVEPGPEADALKRELATFEERIGPSGLFTFQARRGGHDDRVALLINAALADLEGHLPGSRVRPGDMHEHAPRMGFLSP